MALISTVVLRLVVGDSFTVDIGFDDTKGQCELDVNTTISLGLSGPFSRLKLAYGIKYISESRKLSK